jgi:hypothetical protein
MSGYDMFIQVKSDYDRICKVRTREASLCQFSPDYITLGDVRPG